MNRFWKQRWGFWPSRLHGEMGRGSKRQRLARLQLEILEERLVLSVFTVSNTSDSGPGSLRQAILDSNGHPGLNTIAFNIGGGGVQTIRPQLDLPTITNAVTIDGTTQSGYAGTPLIVLNGSQIVGGFGDGLFITTSNCTVKGLVVNGFAAAGIFISGAGGNVITGNFIGTDATGTAAVSNRSGIELGGSNNTLGGTTPGARNLISGNTYDGVGTGGQNVVEGNYIGTDVTGNLPLGNAMGLFINGGTIGGTEPGARNVISGNGTGIKIIGQNRAHIQGNYVGTNAAGTRAVGNRIGIDDDEGGDTIGGPSVMARNIISGNSLYGVLVEAANDVIQGNFIGTDVTGNTTLGNGAGIVNTQFGHSITIGGSVVGAGNVISGNAFYGIELLNSVGPPSPIQGNLIGTNAGGTAALGNAYGVYIFGSSSNLIGGTATQAGNLISGNGTGVFVAFGDGNQIVGNSVGTDRTGTRGIGNGDGVDLVSGTNTVGGEAAGAGNLISGNARNGITIFCNGNLVEGNFIGVDHTGTVGLGNDIGVFLRGANNQIGGTLPGARNVISGNTPPIQSEQEGSGLWISGAGATGNQIEGNLIGTNAAGTAAVPNALDGISIDTGVTGNTIGGEAAGAGNVLSGNRRYGLWVVQAPGNLIQGNFIGTDLSGLAAVPNPIGIYVFSDVPRVMIGGSAPGDRNVISGNMFAGIYGTGAVIQGNFIGTDGTGTRALGNATGISVANYGTVMVGGSVAGAGNLISGNHTSGIDIENGQVQITVQGNRIGTDVSGTAAVGNSQGVFVFFLNPGSGSVTLGGAEPGAGNLISGNQQEGVWLAGSGTLVEGNFIGTDAAGRVAMGNEVGIRIVGLQNTVGGTLAGSGNVISGNRGDGLFVDFVNPRMTPYENWLLGNFVGTDATGTYSLANGGDGINIASGAATSVGGTAPGAGNVISGNSGNGIAIGGSMDSGTISNLVQGNRIGVDVTGASPLGNGGNGVLIAFQTSSGMTIGGTQAAAGNVIAFNGGDGVRVDGSRGNAIRGNTIYGHTNGLGIELVNNGNNNQPAPVLTDAKAQRSDTKVKGTVTGQANTSFTLEFFRNTDCNPSGYGEGEVFLGSLAVMTDAAGNASFTAHLGAVVEPGQFLTATATDPRSNTSEFSQCVVVRGHGDRGSIDRAGARLSDRAGALLGSLGGHLNNGAGGTLMDTNREPVGRDSVAVMVAGDANLAPMVAVGGDWLPARLGADLFFSDRGREGAHSLLPGAVSADPLDGVWESTLGWAGSAL